MEPDYLDPGTLLVSAPRMLDPNFMHTVVLMCRHDEDGAFGLVVNRETGTTSAELLPSHPVLGTLRVPVQAGGPVGLDVLHVLHRATDVVSGGAELLPGLVLGANLDEAARFAAEDPDAAMRLRLILGYAGWGAGQLEAELTEGSWVPRPFDADLVFPTAPGEATWRDALRTLGDDGARLSQEPPDPTWN